MTAMRDDLVKVIAHAGRLNDDRSEDIATAVLRWIAQVPYEGFISENYAAGLYSRKNVSALIEDIEDDA